MAIELATAYVSLTTSAKGLRGEIDKAVGGAVDTTGKKQGSRLGGLLWGGVKTAGIAAGGAIAGAVGVSLYKGFGRLTAIENAEAKLRGLGHSAETVEGIMDNALASVKGTAFGLDEAATTAAGAVAAGIKPGKELERILGLTGDTATIAGTSMGEMGSIFNKVAAGNRLSMAEVNQLSDRGVPIMQMLADQYGVTATEARKMVESGQVDFADFSTAIEDNIAGAALESGNTTEGAFKNMGAALGRVGANLLSGIFPQLKGGFGAITGMLDNLGPTAERVGAAIGTAIQWAADRVGDFVAQFKAGEGAGGAYRTMLEGIRDVVVVAFTWIRDNAIPAIQGFIAEFRNGEGAGGKLRDAFNAIWGAGKVVFGWLRDEALPALQALGDFILNTLWPDIRTAFLERIWPAMKEVGRVIKDFWEKDAQPALKGLWNFIKDVLAPFLVDFYENGIKPTFKLIGDAIAFAWESVIKPTFTALKEGGDSVKERFTTVKDRIKTIWENISGFISGAWDKAKGIFDKFKSGLDSLRDRFRTIKDSISNIWGGVVTAIASPINGAVSFFNGFLSKLESTIRKIPGMGGFDLPRIPAIPVPPRAAHANDNGLGGRTGGYADGGTVAGWSPHAKADNILARLTAGEFVLPVNATKRLMGKLGAGGLEMLRRGHLPAFANGGMVGGGLGDVWDAIKGAGSWIYDVLSDPVGAIKKLGKSLLGGIGDSWPAQILSGVGGDMLGKLGQWVKDTFFGGTEGGGMVPGGMPWQQIWGVIKTLNPAARMTSNQRGVGSRTASGAVSYHGMGRAVDFVSPNMGASWSRLASLPIPWTELYYTPSGFMRRGRIVPRSQVSGITQQNHYDHVHAAYGDGGMVKPLLFDSGGYLPPGDSWVRNNTRAPEPLARLDKGGLETRLSAADRALLQAALTRPAVAQVEFVDVARANLRGNHSLGAPRQWAETPVIGGRRP